MSEISEVEIKTMSKEENYLKGYSDGKSDTIEKIRSEVDSALSEEVLSDNRQQISDVGIGLGIALSIINKYKAESEG